MPDNDNRRRLLDQLKLKRAAAAAAPSLKRPSSPSPPPPQRAPQLSPPSHVLVPASSSPVRESHTVLRTGARLTPSSNVDQSLSPDHRMLYNGTGHGNSLSPLRSSADLSPSSPQPLSRLKKRYVDESPTKPRAAPPPAKLDDSPSSPGPGPIRVGKMKKKPSLIAAAMASNESGASAQCKTLQDEFPSAARHVIMQTLSRHPDNMDSARSELRRLNERGQLRAPPSSTPSQNSLDRFRYSPTAASRPPIPTTTRVPSRPSPAPVAAPAVSKNTVSSSQNAVSPAKRGRKNEKSAIYAKRQGGNRRRDPDEESEASAADSGEESDAYWSGDEGRRRKKRKENSAAVEEDDIDAEGEALRAFNDADSTLLTGTIACTKDQADKIVSLRPFADIDDVRAKLTKTRGVSFKLFESYAEIMEGYVQIDACLNRCEAIADEIARTFAVWKAAATLSSSVTGTPRSDGLNDVKVDVDKVSQLLLSETDSRKRNILAKYIRTQPALLSEGTVLKDYQLLGVNWLNLLYGRRIGCILADEMGLGKTIQVIAFLAHLKERGSKGPHMIFVPASTLENWTREFERFAPEINVQTYYGSQAERAELRADMKHMYRKGTLEVVLASYTQVASGDDLAFFRKKVQFDTCIYDEAHALKNFNTKRYQDLLSIKPKWRLLLTGTPVQNNLQELVSLLMFIHKDIFTDAEPYLRAIFKVNASGQGHQNLLSQQRVSRARTMLTPFVLRRRKANVLTLPPKIETIETVEMTPVQMRLYRETLRRSRKIMQELADADLDAVAGIDTEEKKAQNKKVTKQAERAGNSANILMDLRKAASHPLLFRRLYTDAKVRQLAKACLGCPQWCDSNFEYVVEDLEVMSDAEIHAFASEHEDLESYKLDPESFLEGGKMKALAKHIERCKAEGKRILLFSQFTMILDIIQVALDHLGVRFIRLDGATRTDERQSLVDEFNDDEEITIFLLSTKAGGVGINLTAASVVVIYDQDFNPHNDRQAADRAYRIGQEREVEVIKLISKESIDEDILAIGTTKLQLDDMVGGDAGADAGGSASPADGERGGSTSATKPSDDTAKEVRKSLLTTLRNKFEATGDEHADEDEASTQREKRARAEGDGATQVKVARGTRGRG